MKTNVYVFQTSVQKGADVNTLKSHIDKFAEIKQWNFDLSDPDFRVFRMETDANISKEIVSLFNQFDFKCVELTAEKDISFKPRLDKRRDVNIKLLKVGALVLLISGVVFSIGAFTPPYKQWMTDSTKEYLSIVYHNTINWYVIHIAFVLGLVGSLTSIQILSVSFREENRKALLTIAKSVYGIGCALFIINIAFRLTVTRWAAKHLIENNVLDSNFETWMEWSNVLFAGYMVSGYLSCVLMGIAFRQTAAVAKWVPAGWILFGSVAVLLYPIGFVFFEPPIIIHLGFIVGSIGILYKRK